MAIELQVLEAKLGDAGKGMARIDPRVIEELARRSEGYTGADKPPSATRP